ncbi:hypothetical protein FHL15_003519 [Xylaria flabelliformis]|uniref:AA1-like domain-containing protein n=1 Tax=Xylaria flabelliformis TaxID=2512241 RepID=A0A553I5S9_9PEZI|nr:hypothetical protein FHL15_003519 [Xylaria flabelliformis]
MHFFSSLVFGLGLIAGTQASPAESRGVAVVHLKFHGGPASYDLYVPEDGSVVPTNNDISVSIIDVDTPNYDAISLCTFNTPGQKALVGSTTPQGVKQITVGPPQPVLSVSCRAK